MSEYILSSFELTLFHVVIQHVSFVLSVLIEFYVCSRIPFSLELQIHLLHVFTYSRISWIKFSSFKRL